MTYQGLLASPGLGRRINASPRIVGKVVDAISTGSEVAAEYAEQFAPRFADPDRARAASQVYRSFLLYEYPRWVRGHYADRRLRTPTLWLHGLKDPFFTPGMFKDIAEHADDVRIEYLPDGAPLPGRGVPAGRRRAPARVLLRSPSTARPPRPSRSPRAPKGAFDIDLGTNRSGATYAVYTRDDGDIYRLNVTTGSEVKVTKLSSPTIAERDPTIMRGEIAFIRRDRGVDQLRIGNTSSASKGSRLLVKHRSIVNAELSITHVAYTVTGPGPISDNGARFIRIRNLKTGADRQVYRAVSGGANYANTTRPTYVVSPQGFMWVRTNQGSGVGNRFIRYTLRGSKLAYAKGSSPLTVSSAWAGNLLGAATSTALADTACSDAGVQYCQVGLSGPLQFTATP